MLVLYGLMSGGWERVLVIAVVMLLGCLILCVVLLFGLPPHLVSIIALER